MDSKLIELCKLQLKSIAGDTGKSFKQLTGNSVRVLEICSAIQQQLGGEPAEGESSRGETYQNGLCKNLEKNIHSLLVSMQFFDEFNQRIEHVQEILNLIMLKYCDDEEICSSNEHQELLAEVSEIFSVRAECEVMHSMFPELKPSEEGEAIELF